MGLMNRGIGARAGFRPGLFAAGFARDDAIDHVGGAKPKYAGSQADV